MPMRDGELQEIESEIADLRKLLDEQRRRLQLQESRIVTMNGQLDQMIRTLSQVRETR